MSDATLPAAPGLTVIIPNYRHPERTVECLHSVARARLECGSRVEVVVVDDGSGDHSAEYLRAHAASLFDTLVALEENQGYPGAINAGAAAARGRWLFTLNNDTTVEPHIFEVLLDATETASPDIGHMAAQQRFSHDPTKICSAGLVLDALCVNSERQIGHPVSASETEPTEIFGACGGAAIYRRTMFDALGALDESFRFGLEDSDLAWRAQMAGWRCLYVPGAVVFHDYGGTIAFGSDRRFAQAGRNRVRLVAKNAPLSHLLRWAPRMVLYDAAYIAYVAVRRRSLVPLWSRLEVLRQWRSIRRASGGQRVSIHLDPPLGLKAALARKRAWMREA